MYCYLLFENLQKDRWEDHYNPKIFQNYYDIDNIGNRSSVDYSKKVISDSSI